MKEIPNKGIVLTGLTQFLVGAFVYLASSCVSGMNDVFPGFIPDLARIGSKCFPLFLIVPFVWVVLGIKAADKADAKMLSLLYLLGFAYLAGLIFWLLVLAGKIFYTGEICLG